MLLLDLAANNNHWLSITAAGTMSNRDGIDARVTSSLATAFPKQGLAAAQVISHAIKPLLAAFDPTIIPLFSKYLQEYAQYIMQYELTRQPPKRRI
ncbi:MAG: hypothetical protein HIU91_15410 [Acidobacteria bacterium]|nr:hypothetical protein [Acidobacteriota bacterium]